MNAHLLDSNKPSDATKISTHETTVVIHFKEQLCSVPTPVYTNWIRKHRLAAKKSTAKKAAKKAPKKRTKKPQPKKKATAKKKAKK